MTNMAASSIYYPTQYLTILPRHGKVVHTLARASSVMIGERCRYYSLKSTKEAMQKTCSVCIVALIYENIIDNRSCKSERSRRFRKLFAHAFPDGALLEQEPLLAHYLDLFTTRLKTINRWAGTRSSRRDGILQLYDVRHHRVCLALSTLLSITRPESFLEILSSASPSGLSRAASIICR